MKTRQFTSRFLTLLKDKRTIVLLLILGVGAYLRLWNLEHLFNAVHDYDEAVYTLGARFITEGYLPYRDFSLVHPPFYSMMLSAIFKIFGYNYFYAKYFSVFISLASIILIYFTGKKLSNSTVGLAAAGLFAVSPDMVYMGRRAVQESLGVFLVLLAVYFALDYLSSRKNNRLFYLGLVSGLAAATKYIFLPAVIAIFCFIILTLMGRNYSAALRRFARPSFLVIYTSFCLSFIALLLILSWSLKLPVPVPFFSHPEISWVSMSISLLVFVVPWLLSVWITEKNIRYREYLSGLWGALKQRRAWYPVAGLLAGFLLVTGYFWVISPHEFINQTLQLQGRSDVSFPSLLTMFYLAFSFSSYYERIAYLPILLALPLALLLLNRRRFSQAETFMALAIIIALVFCQGFPGLPRYSISVYPFFLLGLASLVPPAGRYAAVEFRALSSRIKASFLAVAAVFALFISVSLILLTNYGGYDIYSPVFASDEEEVYRETISYLESVSPEKIFAVNPVYAAMSNGIKSTLDFDPYANIWLRKETAEQIVRSKIDEGVDYIVLDAWVRWWKDEKIDRLVMETRKQGRLVKVVAPQSANRTEIYTLNKGTTNIFNGDFEHWARDRDTMTPLGWTPVLIFDTGGASGISKSHIEGKDCVSLSVFETGARDSLNEGNYAAISQTIDFPQSRLIIDAYVTTNTNASPGEVKPAGIHFVAGNRVLIIGFSDSIDREEMFDSGSNSILVLKPVELGRWSAVEVDLASYWARPGWALPAKIEIYLLNSAQYTNPGNHDFYVAGIREE